MKRFFSIYTKRQRIGLYILCVVVVLSIGLNIIVRFHTRHKLQREMYQDSLFQQEVFLFFNEEIAKPKNTKQKQFLTKNNQQKEKNVKRFVFDPNTIEAQELRELGFSNRAISNLLKYRQKGGRFSKPEDLKKIYGVTEKLYSSLVPYIEIKSIAKSVEQTKINADSLQRTPIISPHSIELNSVDTTKLYSIPGLRKGIMRSMLKYRDRLGGFIQIEQIKEVRYISNKECELLMLYGFVDTNAVKKINVNTATINRLDSHPYITYENAKFIFEYRRTKGKIKNLEKLNEILSSEDYKKISPYLSVE